MLVKIARAQPPKSSDRTRERRLPRPGMYVPLHAHIPVEPDTPLPHPNPVPPNGEPVRDPDAPPDPRDPPTPIIEPPELPGNPGRFLAPPGRRLQ
jgi:hypothetical protein